MKPEFANRSDIEEIARICAPIRNAAHLERLVRDEHRPRYHTRPKPKAGFEEPSGWREYLSLLPQDDWRRGHAGDVWANVPEVLKQHLCKPSHAA